MRGEGTDEGFSDVIALSSGQFAREAVERGLGDRKRTQKLTATDEVVY